MSLCQMHKDIEEEVIDFSAHVQSAGEESITDYLFWRWSLANRMYSHFTAKTFTKPEESRDTGADFEMEVWFVGKTFSLPLAIQAKKISIEHNSYRKAFSYPDYTKQQIRKLLSYARNNKRVPLYMFYSQSALCSYSKTPDCGVYIASALDIEKFANLPKGSALPKTKILDRCIHFYELFCDSSQKNIAKKNSVQNILEALTESLAKKSALTDELIEQIESCKTEVIPNYVQLILNSDQQSIDGDKKLAQEIEKMRKSDTEIEPRKIIVVDARLKY